MLNSIIIKIASILKAPILKSIQIIDKETLIKDYGIEGKEYGVIIISEVPKSLFNGKDSF